MIAQPRPIVKYFLELFALIKITDNSVHAQKNENIADRA
jgi:hypothetical protein